MLYTLVDKFLMNNFSNAIIEKIVDLKKKNVQTSLSKDKDMSVDIYTDSNAHTRDNQEYAASYKLDSCGMFRQYKYIFGAQRS